MCSQDAGLPVVSAKFMKWHLRRSFLKLAIKEGGWVMEGKHWMILWQVFWVSFKEIIYVHATLV